MLPKNRFRTTGLAAGVLLVAVVAAARPGTGGEAAAGQFARASSWGFEVFGRGSWNRTGGREEVTIGVSAGEDRDSVTSKSDLGAWDPGGGLGVRATRGRVGVEASWLRIRTRAVRRFAPYAGASGADADDLAVDLSLDGTADADLFVGQIVVRTAPGGAVTGFFGLGAGWLRVSDPVAGEFEAGAPLGAVPPELLSAFAVEVESDAGQAVLGGSAGVTIQAGRVFLRPRVEAWVGRELAGNYRIVFGAPLLPGDIGIDLSSTLRPTFLMFAVDLGLDLR